MLEDGSAAFALLLQLEEGEPLKCVPIPSLRSLTVDLISLRKQIQASWISNLLTSTHGHSPQSSGLLESLAMLSRHLPMGLDKP